MLTIPCVYGGSKRISVVPPAPPPRALAPVSLPPSWLSVSTEGAEGAFLVLDDRHHLNRQHRLLLVIEDDIPFARILLDLSHELDFQCLVAHQVEGVRLAVAHGPDAVLLDMHLPDHTGLFVLDQLKRNSATRHIPVHMMSVADDPRQALAMGTIGYLLKPVRREDLLDVFKKFEAC